MSLLTPVATLSFPALFTPKANKLEPNKPAQYTAMLTIPKTADISHLVAEITRVAREKFGADVNLASLKMPIKDGDVLAQQKGDAWYAGKWVLNTSATLDYPPQVLNEQRLPVVDKATIYAGCQVVAAVRFFGYDKTVNKGVSCGLTAVMKVGDGDRLDNKVDATKLFANVQPLPSVAGAVAAAQAVAGAGTGTNLFGGAQPQAAAPVANGGLNFG